MRRQVRRSAHVEAADQDSWTPARPWPISPGTVAEGVAAVEDACHGRRSGYCGLEAAVAHIGRSAGFEVGHVYLSDPAGGRIVPSHIWYLQPPASRFSEFVHTTAASPLVPGHGLPGQVVSTGAPVFVDPLPGDAHMPRARSAIASGLRSACAFPVDANPRLTVVLEFLATDSIHPSGELRTLVERLAAALVPHLRDLEVADLL